MRVKSKPFMVLVGLSFFSSPAYADYLRTGPASATVSTYFGFSMSTYEVIYVEDDRGQKYQLSKNWESVEEFRIGPKKNTCYIKVSYGNNPIGWALNFIKNPSFYGRKWKTNDQPIKISPDYLRFPCIKR